MSLDKKIARRNQGLRTVRIGTVAVAVGGVASAGVLTVGMAASSGALDATAQPSADATVDVAANSVVSPRSVVGKDKARKTKPKPTPTPAPPPNPPAPANNSSQGGGKSHGS